jgi:hypothetical protein
VRIDRAEQARGEITVELLAEERGADNRERAKFWEIWHKGERRVVW